jgi:hypothetical protein
VTDTDRKCRKCGETKPLTEYPKNKHAPGGIDKMCKQCWRNRKSKSADLTGYKPEKPAKVYRPTVDVDTLLKGLRVQTLSKFNQLPKEEPMFECEPYNLEEKLDFIRTKKLEVKTVYSITNKLKITKFFITTKEQSNDSQSVLRKESTKKQPRGKKG